MPFIVIDGLTIPARLNEQSGSPFVQGEVVRMFSGRARSTRRGGLAETWSLVTTPQTVDAARAIEALTASPGPLPAYGDLLGRDSDAPIDVFVRPGRVQPRKYASGEHRVVSFEVEEAHPLDTVLRYAPGFGNLAHSRTDTATVATYVDQYAMLQTVSAAGDLRAAHYIDGVRHTLLEPARTNGWTYSEQLGNAVWGKTNASITANSTTAPDGVVSADKLVEDATAGGHRISRPPPTLTDDTRQSFSLFAKAGERSWIMMQAINKAGAAFEANFNLASGEVGSVTAGATTRMVALGSGWYRCELVFGSGTGATAPSARVYLATGDGANSYTGDGSSGVHLWGLQFEADGGFATSYIKTVAATVTRAVDIASAALPPAIASPRTAWTRYTRYVAGMDQNGDLAAPRIWEIGDGGSTQRLLLFWVTSSALRLQHDNGSASDAATVTATVDKGDIVEAVVRWNGDGTGTLIVYVNEMAVGSATLSGITPAGAWNGSATTRLNARNASGANGGGMALRDDKFAYRGGRIPLQGTADTLLRQMRHL